MTAWWVLACAPVPDAPVQVASDATVFVDATVFPTGEQVHVVVQDGEIVQLVDAALEIQGASREIDAAGQVLVPGLVDTHVHVWHEGDFWLYLANGVTTVRNLAGSETQLAWRDEIAQGLRTGPTLLTSGPIVDGPDAYWPTSEIVTDAETGRAVGLAQVDAGYDAIKVYDDVPADAWDALVQVAQETGVPVVGHVPDDVGYRAVIQGGQRTVEHLDNLLSAATDQPAFSSFDRHAGQTALDAWTDDTAGAIAVDSAASGVVHVPTLTVWNNLAAPDTWDFTDPRLDLIDPSVRRSWRQTQAAVGDADAAWFGDYTDALCAFTGALHDAGASLALGTDVINPFVFPGWSTHDELALLVACGLSPEAAIGTATWGAADALDQPGAFGEITEGARADLVLVDGDPWDDVGALADPVGVMVAGVWFTAAELDAQLDILRE